MRLGGQTPGVPDFETIGISKAILPILLKPCTITPQANLELEATHGMRLYWSTSPVSILPQYNYMHHFKNCDSVILLLALLIYTQYINKFECSLLNLGVGFGRDRLFYTMWP